MRQNEAAAGTKAVHDLLLDLAPEGASHDPDTCQFCKAADSEPEGAMTTYTEEQLRSEVDRATAALQEQIRELQEQMGASQTDAAIAAAVEEATAPLNEQVADLTTRLDAAVAEARTATEQHSQLVALLEETEEARLAAEQADERKESRVASVLEVAKWFTDEDVAERADRWAALDDDAFADQIAEYKVLAAKFDGDGSEVRDLPPSATAMTAAAGGGANGGGSGRTRTTAVRDAFALRGTGLDPKSLR